MGGNSPSRVSGEDEGGGITFVKGIRLSDRVINRMKQSPKVICPHPPEMKPPTATPVPAPSVENLLPPVIPTPPPSSQETPVPSAEPAVTIISPPPVKFHSLPPTSVDPAAPPPPPFTPSPKVESPAEPLPPLPAVAPPSAEAFVLPPPVDSSQASAARSETSSSAPPTAPPVETLKSAAPSSPPVETVQLPPTVESAPVVPVTPVFAEASVPSNALQEVPPVMAPVVDSKPACDLHQSLPTPDSVAAPSTPPPPVLSFEESSCQRVGLSVGPTDPPVAPPPPIEEPTKIPSVPPVVENEVHVVTSAFPLVAGLEEELRQKLKEEMQRSLKEEINQKRQEMQRQLEKMRAQARAEAKAAAQAQVEEQVKKIMEAERAAYTEKLTDSIMKERMKTKDEKLMVQLYWMELKAHQLEEKEKELKKRDALYKEHLAKLEAKCAEFYKASVESFQKGKEETHNRFVRFNIQPVCGDLQSQILKCYKENTGKILCCSGIASAYMQCVDEAKKNKLSTGG